MTWEDVVAREALRLGARVVVVDCECQDGAGEVARGVVPPSPWAVYSELVLPVRLSLELVV